MDKTKIWRMGCSLIYLRCYLRKLTSGSSHMSWQMELLSPCVVRSFLCLFDHSVGSGCSRDSS
jgi:hypothetical protein